MPWTGFVVCWFRCDTASIVSIDWRCDAAQTTSPNLDMHVYTTLLVSMLLVFRTTSSFEGYKGAVQAFSSMITVANNLATQICGHIRGPHNADKKAALQIERTVHQLTRLCVLMCITIRRHLKGNSYIVTLTLTLTLTLASRRDGH